MDWEKKWYYWHWIQLSIYQRFNPNTASIRIRVAANEPFMDTNRVKWEGIRLYNSCFSADIDHC